MLNTNGTPTETDSPPVVGTDDFERENEEARGRMTMLGLVFVVMAGVIIGGLFALLVHTIHPW